MRSFDFYDTLVTRLVATPADIFSLVGERLEIPTFRSMRIAAEVAARRSAAGEVTLQQIYDLVPLAPAMKKLACRLELEFERSLVAGVTAVCSQMRTGDLIVSDMYLDEAHYRDLLARLVPGVVPGAILISGQAGVSKDTGGLWKKVVTDYPGHELHVGDNMSADIHQARRNGLATEHFTGALLNSYEVALLRQGVEGSLIAGASRAARLSLTRHDSSESEAATIEAFASVFGPLFVSFAHWIMKACEAHGIRDAYFLARDGQLPFRICSRLAAETGQELRCRYIFASRQALHLPGCATIDDAETWILDNTPQLTLRTISDRARVPLDVVLAAAAPHLTAGPDEDIPRARRGVLRSLIRDAAFVRAFTTSVDRAFHSAAAYYRGEGLASGEDRALVDIGWNGRLQWSLNSLLKKSGCRPGRTQGLYLCVAGRHNNAPADEIFGFLSDPECPKLASFFNGYRPVLEAAFSADHPTTVGFEIREGEARPVFGEPDMADAQKKIAFQHAVVDKFVENVIAIGRAAGRSIVPPTEAVAENLMQFLSRPSRKDAKAFLGFPFVGGQTGNDIQVIARLVRPTEVLRRKRNLGYWTAGSLSASGLSALTFLRRAAGRIRGRLI